MRGKKRSAEMQEEFRLSSLEKKQGLIPVGIACTYFLSHHLVCSVRIIASLLQTFDRKKTVKRLWRELRIGKSLRQRTVA
jgi:hypothetical protein